MNQCTCKSRAFDPLCAYASAAEIFTHERDKEMQDALKELLDKEEDIVI